MGRKKKHTHTIPKHINKKEKEKEPLTLIRVIRNNKNPQRERERERVLTRLCEKNMDWIRKIISNLQKIKQGEKESKHKKEEESITVKQIVVEK